MAVRAGEVLAETCEVNINENELAFLALHLGAAYDRVNSLKRYRAIMIIPNNQMLSKMCRDKLKIRFEERMMIVQSYGFLKNRWLRKKNRI